MMGITKNHFLLIPVICVLAAVIIGVLFYTFVFGRTPIFCNGRIKLAELFKADFTDIEITGVQYENSKDGILDNYAYVFVFLKESCEFESKEYYFNGDGGGFSDPNLEHIPPGHIVKLKGIGIELANIKKHGGNWSQIRVGAGMTSFEIHWYQIDDSYDGKSNVVLLAGIPRKISINVDKIIQEK